MKQKTTIILLLIIMFGAAIRLIALNRIPLSLNIDETALGYNAYSIMRTGADEWGKFLPLSLRSFGDWKLPVYPLLTIPSIIVFGLNEFSVRFLSAISGVIAIWLIYKIVKILFEKTEIALLASFFFSISPWSIFFSRIAFEPNVGITFILAAFLLILSYVYEKGSPKRLLFASLLLGLTFFTYHSFLVFTPMFTSVMVLLYRKKLIRDKYTLASIVIFLFFLLLFLFSMVSSGSASKTSTVTLFNDPSVLYDRVEQLRADNTDNVLTKHLLHNRWTGVLTQMVVNYTSSFSPQFLLDGKSAKDFASMRVFGYIYVFDCISIMVGLFTLFWKRNKRALYPLLLWLLVAPLPSMIARESPSATRLIGLLPVLVILSSYGIWTAWEYLQTLRYPLRLGAALILLAVMLYNVALFADAYIYHMNTHQAVAFHDGYKEAVMLTEKYPDKKVVMVGPENFPYISFLFYTKYDPIKFRQEVVYYPAKNGEFNLVKSFGRYTFVRSIDTAHIEPNTIYIDNADPKETQNVIKYPNGDAKFKYAVH